MSITELDDDVADENKIFDGNLPVTNDDASSSAKLTYRVGEDPGFFGSLAHSFQHVALCVGGLVGYPTIAMKILCADDSDSMTANQTAIISTCSVAAGITTILQTVLGVRLPLFQGTSIAYLVAMIAVMNDPEMKCPERMLNYSSSVDNVTFLPRYGSESYFWYTDQDGAIRNSEELWLRRLQAIQGAVIVCAIAQMLVGITGVVGYMTRFIGPLTIAPILIMLGYGIATPCTDLCSTNWAISAITMATYWLCAIFLGNVRCSFPYVSWNRRPMKLSCRMSKNIPIFATFPVLFAIGVGWVAAAIWDYATSTTGSEHAGDIVEIFHSTPWFSLPYPFQFGLPSLSAACVLGMLTAVIPGILESVGDYNATACACDEQPPPKHAINRGIFIEGVGILLSGLLGNGNATTSWTANIPLISISKVASRKVFVFVGIILVLLGIFPKSLCIFVNLPQAVVGSVLLCLTGMIVSIGISTLLHVDMTDTRNMFVLGLSILGGIVSSMYVNKYSSDINTGYVQLDGIMVALLGNSMFVSGMLGFSLDAISPGSRISRGFKGYYNSGSSANRNRSLNIYDLPSSCCVKCSGRIPISPRFGKPADTI